MVLEGDTTEEKANIGRCREVENLAEAEKQNA